MRRGTAVAALAAASLLAACATVLGPSVPPDPEAARLNGAIGERAATFHAGLPAKTAPDCAFAANEGEYRAMREDAGALERRVAAGPGDDAMRRAAAGLTKAIEAAETSHRLASARTDDRFGACMAPRAITSNAGAVARATQAIADLQQARSR